MPVTSGSAPGNRAYVAGAVRRPAGEGVSWVAAHLQVGQAALVSQPQELVGTFVVEVGEREAWPFMTFCDDDTTPSREARLYIDTELTVNRSNVWLSADELPTARLFRLNNLGVAAVSAGDAELSITFDDGGQMIVSGVASAWTMDQLRSEQPACRRIHRGSVSTIGIPGDGSRPLDPTSVLAQVTPSICYPFPYVDWTVQLCPRITFLPILRVHACSRRRAGTHSVASAPGRAGDLSNGFIDRSQRTMNPRD